MEISDVEKMKANKDVKGLIKALKDKDFNVQWRAAEALGKMGEPAVELLIEALKDESIDVRHKAAYALAAIGTPAVIAPLLEIFRTVKQSKIREDGSVTDEDKGEDGAPASALVIVSGGFGKLGW